jgi:hypothetical protein
MHNPSHHPGSLQLENFLYNEFLPVLRLTPYLLLHGAYGMVHGQLVLDNFPRDPGKLKGIPRKYVGVFPYESNQLAFLLSREMGSDDDGAGRFSKKRHPPSQLVIDFQLGLL